MTISTWNSAALYGLLLTAFLSQVALGQAVTPPPPSPMSDKPAVGPVEEPRDPTQPKGELRLLLTGPENAPAGPGAPPLQTSLPVVVRARIIGPGKRSAALLFLGGTYYHVVPGQSYAVLGSEREFKVAAITGEGVVLEVSPDKRQLILP